MKRLALTDYDYIAKTLSITVYRTHYVEQLYTQEYRQYIERFFNHNRLAKILSTLPVTIGANILHSSKQAYDPHGASVSIMLEEAKNTAAMPTAWLAHLDKSHITAHTYPERFEGEGVSVFRADIEISTCGLLTPLLCLNKVFHYFKPDVAVIDYRLRGFIKDSQGQKDFLGEPILPIEEYLRWPLRSQYDHQHEHLSHRQLFHTRMIKKPNPVINPINQMIEAEKQSIFYEYKSPRTIWPYDYKIRSL